MQDVLVSVIIPAYNCEQYIGEAIQSVCAQTYKNMEILVIDDCATDGTRKVAEALAKQDSRIKLLCNAQNMGVASTRNRGIECAKGDFIALLDGDDIWLPEKIEKQIRLLSETKADIAYCSYDFISRDGKPIGHPFLVSSKTNFKQMLRRNEIGCSTCCICAQALKKHPFNNSYYHEDYVLWLELLQSGCKAAGLTQVMTHYRRMEGTRSNNKINAAKMRWKIYREYLKLPITKSMWFFACYALEGTKKYYA